MRVAIGSLLALKIAGLALTPQGLCARFSTSAPFVGETHTIPIDEPEGWLRSWDVRADWREQTFPQVVLQRLPRGALCDESQRVDTAMKEDPWKPHSNNAYEGKAGDMLNFPRARIAFVKCELEKGAGNPACRTQ